MAGFCKSKSKKQMKIPVHEKITCYMWEEKGGEQIMSVGGTDEKLCRSIILNVSSGLPPDQ